MTPYYVKIRKNKSEKWSMPPKHRSNYRHEHKIEAQFTQGYWQELGYHSQVFKRKK